MPRLGNLSQVTCLEQQKFQRQSEVIKGPSLNGRVMVNPVSVAPLFVLVTRNDSVKHPRSLNFFSPDFLNDLNQAKRLNVWNHWNGLRLA